MFIIEEDTAACFERRLNIQIIRCAIFGFHSSYQFYHFSVSILKFGENVDFISSLMHLFEVDVLFELAKYFSH